MRLLLVLALSVVLLVYPSPRVAASSADGAIGWALDRVGLHVDPQTGHPFDGWCLWFAREAFRGTSSATDAWTFYLKLGQPNRGAKPPDVPRGALVFFAPTNTNKYGHVAIALGGSQMVGPLSAGPRTGVQITSISWVRNFVGWSQPPSDWPGREFSASASPSPVVLRTMTPTPSIPATTPPTIQAPPSPTNVTARAQAVYAGCPPTGGCATEELRVTLMWAYAATSHSGFRVYQGQLIEILTPVSASSHCGVLRVAATVAGNARSTGVSIPLMHGTCWQVAAFNSVGESRGPLLACGSSPDSEACRAFRP